MNPFEKAISSLGIGYKTAAQPRETSVFTGQGDTPLDFKTIAKDIPCQAACPAKTNVPAYLEAIAQGDPQKAYLINQEDNVFPGVLGRICTRPCEDACRHNWTGVQGPVQICHLKRAGADYKARPPEPLPAWFEDTGKRVAIVGGGAAGLTAARELKRYGHRVTIFEKNAFLGGMMMEGIPKFRLPRHIVQEEAKAIVDSGVEVKYGQHVDAARMQALADDYDVVLVAAGAARPSDLKLEGLEKGVEVPGLEFMRRYNAGEIGPMEKQSVLVVGGGFTAVDCARSCARAARRLVGPEGNVAIMYRRTEAQMSANMDELEQLRMENIRVETLVSPVSARTSNGKLKAVTFHRNMLGEGREGGKPSITAIQNSEFEEPCDTLIVAIGQVRTLDILPEGVRLTEGHRTTHDRIFVTGDFAYGSLDVIHAVEDGKAVADEMDTILVGEQRHRTHVAIELREDDARTGRVRDHDLQRPADMPVNSIFERLEDQEVETGFSEDAAGNNAMRCYFCHYKFEIDQDKCIHCDWCIKVAPRECIVRASRVFKDEDGAPTRYVEASLAKDATFIWIDSDQCIRCGNCLRVCPTEAISMRKSAVVNCKTSKATGDIPVPDYLGVQ
jgi:formate dehydrogenase major subunit